MIRSPLHHSRHRGMALIDVIVGGMLLAISLAVVISLATRSLAMQTDGEKRLIASWIADECLNMVLIEGPINYPRLYDNSATCDYPFDQFEYDIYIEDQGVNAPHRVTATVRWPSGTSYQEIKVQTLI